MEGDSLQTTFTRFASSEGHESKFIQAVQRLKPRSGLSEDRRDIGLLKLKDVRAPFARVQFIYRPDYYEPVKFLSGDGVCS